MVLTDTRFRIVAACCQLVSARLAHQGRQIEDGDAKAALQAAVTQIAAIARVHRHLYRQAEAGKVALDRYLEALVADLGTGCGRGADLGRVRVQADAARVPADFASALGLVITELVINACKHAYAPDDTGDIHIRFARVGREAFWLEVQDDGLRGPPFPRERASGLGSELIDGLCRRLGVEHGYIPMPRGTRFLLSGLLPVEA